MSVLLMAFFVIMLMAAETDVPKFNAFASVMRQTFGQVPLDPNDADKGGTSILDLHFGPQSGEQTTDPPATTPQSGDPDIPDSGKAEGVDDPGGGASGGATPDGQSATSQDGAAASAQDGVDQAAKALAKAMADAVAAGELTVESEAGKVVVRLPKGTGKAEAEKIAAAIGAIAFGTVLSALLAPPALVAASAAAFLLGGPRVTPQHIRLQPRHCLMACFMHRVLCLMAGPLVTSRGSAPVGNSGQTPGRTLAAVLSTSPLWIT